MRSTLKRVADGLALLLVLPCLLGYRIGAWLLGAEKAFPGWSQAFGLLPGLSGAYLRRAFYRMVLPRFGADAVISFGSILSHPTAEVGRGAYVGAYCCLGDVTLEDDVLLGSNVSVINGRAQHGIDRLDVAIRDQPGHWVRVTIGRDSWVGEKALVMADVGRHCIIGAGSVVTKPVPDYAIAIGAPARVVRFRDPAAGGPRGDGAPPAAATARPRR